MNERAWPCRGWGAVPGATNPTGFAAIGGSRIPLIMFGGKVTQGIDPHWHSHASIPRKIIDLLGLPPMGVPRVDTAPTLAGHVETTLTRPEPPAPGTVITQPTPPHPPPRPVPPAPWAGPLGQPMPPLITQDGSTLPAPTDGGVKPPKPPKQPASSVLVSSFSASSAVDDLRRTIRSCTVRGRPAAPPSP